MKQLPTGVVNIRGKEYQTVALRVHNFREQFPEFALITEVLHRDVDCVVMKATISDKAGRVIATGHAEEYRKASEINRTSALENAETSAIGRALAALGIGGTEFASADEVARAISGEKGEPPADPLGMFPAQAKSQIMKSAQAAIAAFREGNEWGAYEELTSCAEKLGKGDNSAANQVKLALASIYGSTPNMKAAIRALAERENQKATTA